MTYYVRIEAQVEWAAEVEADSYEAAEEEAKEQFETSQWTNDTSIELINRITVVEAEQRGEGAEGGEK